MSSHSSHRKHKKRHKNYASDIVIVLAGLALVLLFVFSDMRYKNSYARGGQEDEIVTVTTTTTTTTTMPPVKDNKAILDLPFNYIAYSKINGFAHCINTAEQYLWSAKKEFTALKGDVRITSDGKLIMCLDDGITVNKDGKIVMYDSKNAVPIRDMTEEECLDLRHDGRNTPLCTFDEYVTICKEYDKIAFITIWDEYLDEIIPQMIRTLKKHEMLDKCIANSYKFASLQAVRKAEPTIVLSKMMEYESELTVEVIDEVASMGNCVINAFDFSKITKFKDVDDVIDLEILDYAKTKNVRVYEAQVHSMAIVNKLKEYGYSGAQMMVAPVFE